MKTGICGGTFDPLHKGHEALVRAALDSKLVDQVIVIPSGTPPHKRQELISMARYRYEMVSRTFADEPRIKVSDVEILRSGPSYTLDTARQLKEQNPGDDFCLIYGSDVLKDIERWHQPVALLATWPLILADRGGIAGDLSRQYAADLHRRFGASIRFFDAPSIELSGTMIRKLAANGEPIGHLVPAAVDRLVQKHGLYRWQDELLVLDYALWDELREIERSLWTMLTPKRQIHSLNVLNYALHLAIRHGISSRQTALAAILHDCAKCLPADRQLALALESDERALLDEPLVHGPAGAVLARQRFGILDEAVLHAIHCHTTGCADMTPLDQIIFVADKVEPGRNYANLDEIRSLAETNLNQATRLCLQEIELYLRREQLSSHPYAGQALADMHNRIKLAQNEAPDNNKEPKS
ncbi:MAG: nicotinate-nucleotide adenylyltransferase [Bacillota bacterium]|nr:nicotinate-nucleotide adenylyltransferase [Bacillota bacterium]